MSERPPGQTPPPVEENSEHIPTVGDVRQIIESMMVKGECQIAQTYLDAEGKLYRLDAVAPGREEGETLELFYLRKGSYPSGDKAAETEIHSTYIKDGQWNGTGPQASLVDNIPIADAGVNLKTWKVFE